MKSVRDLKRQLREQHSQMKNLEELSTVMCNDHSSIDDINVALSNIAHVVLNCIVSNDVEWLLVTEFDAYFRSNETIDDCALKHTEYGYSKDLRYVQEYGWSREDQMDGSPPVHKPFRNLGDGRCTRVSWYQRRVPTLGHVTNSLVKTPQQQHLIYTSQTKAEFVTFARKLQNFNKSASGHQWRYVSKAFFDKGFYCIDPFSFKTSNNPLLAAAAIILTCFTQKKYDDKDHEQ